MREVAGNEAGRDFWDQSHWPPVLAGNLGRSSIQRQVFGGNMDTPTRQENAGASPPGQREFTSRQKAVISWITGITIGLLVVASLVAWYHQPSPVAVARQYLSEQGVAADNLDTVGYRGFSPFLPGVMDAAWVDFRVKGANSPRLEVELSRPVYFLPWHGSAFREVKE